jgi:hypothetical protein
MPRVKLTITEVKEPRSVGQAEVLDFMATGEGNKALKYGVWSKSLYEYIKSGAVIDAEVVTKESDKTDDNGNHYVNRKVTNIYVNGEAAVKKGGFGGGGGYKDSPETRISIENMSCMKGIFDLRIANALTDESPEYQTALAWAHSHFSTAPVSQHSQSAKDGVTPDLERIPVISAHARYPANAKIGDRVQIEETGDIMVHQGDGVWKPKDAKAVKEPANLGEFLSWVIGHGKDYNKTWLLKTFSFQEPELKDAKRLHDAYLEVKQQQNW